jgi:opacity protein-like surface antigen
MKNTLKVAALLSMVASSANAAENNYYLGLSGITGKGEVKITDEYAQNPDKYKFRPKGGEVAIGAYMTPDFRSEIAFGYQTGKKSFNDAATSFNEQYKAKNYSVMLNGHYVFVNQTIAQPYVMAGIGYSHNKVMGATNTNLGSGSAKKSKGSFAAQAGAGLQVMAAPNLLVDIGYRAKQLGFNSISLDAKTKAKFKPEHVALAGIKIVY